jgi:cytochrome c oxidase cbb3-type subunit 4
MILLSLTYEKVAAFSQVASLLMFIAMFAGVVLFALWPKNGQRFEVAQRRALDLDRDMSRGERERAGRQ